MFHELNRQAIIWEKNLQLDLNNDQFAYLVMVMRDHDLRGKTRAEVLELVRRYRGEHANSVQETKEAG